MSIRCIALTRQGTGIATFYSNRDHLDKWEVEDFPSRFPFTCMDTLAVDNIESGQITLVAGTQGQGICRSEDSGKNWEPFALAGVIVKSIRVTPSRILVGTKHPPLIYSSDDRGETWTELEGFRAIPSRPLWFSPAEKPYTAYVQGLDHAPHDPDKLIVGIEAGAVVCSHDGGDSWGDHRPGAMRDCHAIGFHPRNPDYAYAVGSNDQGAAISRDGGNTWEDCSEGLEHRYAWAYAVDPTHPECWFVAAAPGPRQAHSDDGNAQAHIYRRTPKGWERLQGGLPDPLPSMPYTLTMIPAQPGVLYAGLRNGQVYRGREHGTHWEQLPFRFDGIRRTLLIHAEPAS